MLTAAEELMAATTSAMLAGRDVALEVQRIEHIEGVGAAAGVDSVEELMQRFNRHVDEVTVRTMRVSLLFGIGTVAEDATEFNGLFTEMRRILWREQDHHEEVDFDVCFNNVILAAGNFIEVARAEIRKSPSARAWGLVLRPVGALRRGNAREH
jgi:hypothetical protein